MTSAKKEKREGEREKRMNKKNRETNHFFCFLGGVTGLPEPIPPYWYFCFFSAGLRIWKLHSKLSSTDIMAPALSNSPQ